MYIRCVRDTNVHIDAAIDAFRTDVPLKLQHEKANIHGYKWTEFLRLPYFDATRFVTIDAMHCLFLGELNEHRTSWHIRMRAQTTRGMLDELIPPQIAWLAAAATCMCACQSQEVLLFMSMPMSKG
jgi:hypothetical protein